MSRPGGGGANAAMSIDAKLAAQAQQAQAGSSSNSSNSNTPKMQQSSSQQLQQQSAAIPPAATTAAATTNTTTSSHRSKKEEHLLLSLPSNDTGIFATGRWETGDEARCCGSDAEDGDYTDYTNYPRLSNRGNKLAPGSRAIRRGRLGGWDNHEPKIDGRSAIQQGLLKGSRGGNDLGASVASSTTGAGGTVNGSLSTSVTSTKGGASTVPPPHGTLEHNFLLIDDQKKSHSGLPTGKDVYPITPSLTFVPSSSTAAARPDREPPAYSFLPGPNSPTSPSALSPRKRRKIYSSYTGLASTSGSTSNHTSAPVRAYLPVPPQNPIELVMSPLITRTFSPRNNALEKLSLHATDLIEHDLPLVRALTRVVDLLRGNTVVGSDGSLGLPFNNDNERVIAPEEQPVAATATNGTDKNAETDGKAKTEDESQTTAATEDSMDVDKAEHGAVPSTNDNTDTTEAQANGEGNAESNPRKRRRTASMEIEGEASTDVEKEMPKESEETNVPGSVAVDSKTSALNGSSIDDATGSVAVAAAETAEEAKGTEAEKAETHDIGEKTAKVEADGPATKVEEATAVPTDKDLTNKDSDVVAKNAEQAMSSNEAVHDTVQGSVEMLTNGDTTAKTALITASAESTVEVPKSTQASRQPSPSGTATMGNNEEEDEQMDSTVDEQGVTTKKVPGNTKTRLPESLKRIANPAPYITSLLVSKSNVNVAIPPGAPGSIPSSSQGAYHWSDLLLPSGEATLVQAQASTSSGASGVNAEASASMASASSSRAGASDASSYPQYRSLSTAEQEDTVHLCVQELTKFLSDTLEYRDRLGEIRDSILGVDKRRKGVWTMARSYAHQLLWEEEQDKLAQGI